MSIGQGRKRALIASVRFGTIDDDEFRYSLAECRELSETAGFIVAGEIIQSKSEPDVSCFMGKGKLEEAVREYGEKADVIIFNHELSPSQIRNVEKATGFRAVTRTEVILDIFAIHAKSRAAKLQVEMASLSYQMPRIIGKGIEMSRIEGGIGMKGPGEQQLELDRRKIRYRISAIKRELARVIRERDNQRKKRGGTGRSVAIVGYTNSGKSTLLNRLVREKVAADNRLFVTLDTTTRKLWLGGHDYGTITDTVGFIRDIPHGLIESFKSTFEDALSADMRIHLVDLSAPDVEDKRRVVENVLLEMEKTPATSAIPVRTLLVFNKVDLVTDEKINRARHRFPDALFISAGRQIGIDDLRNHIRIMLS
jgi:GTP-binding protein HflX